MSECRRIGVAEDGRPFCVHGPMTSKGRLWWRCKLKQKARKAKYQATSGGKARRKVWKATYEQTPEGAAATRRLDADYRRRRRLREAGLL